MGFQHGASFRICGVVVRRFVSQSGKAAFVTLNVAGDRGGKKIELRAFDQSIVDEIGALGAGQIVEVTGTVDVEKLTNKKRETIKVDGYEKWFPALVIRALTVEGSSRAPAAPTNGTPAETPPAASTGANWQDEDVGF